MSIELKSTKEIERMRAAGLFVYEVHQVLAEMVQPGVTTRDLDRKAHELCRARGAIPAFLNYPSASSGVCPFPGVICASANEVIVHGIPDDRPLEEGDILSIDFGCCIDEFFGDAAVTHAVGTIDAAAQELLTVTEASLEDAIRQCYAGNRIGDISHAVQSRVERHGFGVVREFVGHGIGRRMHEPPHVPNFGRSGQGRLLKPGMVLAIEPMVTAGGFETKVVEDGWTAVTRDGSLAAHFEHTVAITDGEPYVLSRP
ncbi:MAG: type I methionyl aminopeptidase [Bdellovibrionales bacterium]|nr:type I methionyl aminopeptidase [Bdellovibrionales bacterium]